MSQHNGDKSLFNRKRKAKIARRLRWRDATTPAPEASAKPAAKSSTSKS